MAQRTEQQTAVEWLREAIEYNLYMHPSNTDWLPSLVEQAKELEKKQTIYAYKHGQSNGYNYRGTGNGYIGPEDYYNQTHKTQSQ